MTTKLPEAYQYPCRADVVDMNIVDALGRVMVPLVTWKHDRFHKEKQMALLQKIEMSLNEGEGYLWNENKKTWEVKKTNRK